jgi:UDP-N-acetylglucosamine 2-epimerase (non-hydrolysing)
MRTKTSWPKGSHPSAFSFVGSVLIDSLHWTGRKRTNALERFGLHPERYALVTLHRPANVDTRESLGATLAAVEAVSRRIPVLLPLHPRTVERVKSLGLSERIDGIAGLKTCEPVGYNDYITLMCGARLVATDSGGIQEETTALGIPCLTLRKGTERPITVEQGTNVVVGLDVSRIESEVESILAGTAKRGRVPDGWDGRAAERIADALQALTARTGIPNEPVRVAS